jgi:hypothetical protein
LKISRAEARVKLWQGDASASNDSPAYLMAANLAMEFALRYPQEAREVRELFKAQIKDLDHPHLEEFEVLVEQMHTLWFQEETTDWSLADEVFNQAPTSVQDHIMALKERILKHAEETVAEPGEKIKQDVGGALPAEPQARCPWALKLVTLTTRCKKKPHPDDTEHNANGLKDFPYQRINWFAGDRREFRTERTDEYAWEE